MRRGEGFAIRVTLETLPRLRGLLWRPNQEIGGQAVGKKAGQKQGRASRIAAAALALFSGRPFKIISTKPLRTSRAPSTRLTRRKKLVPSPATKQTGARGPLRWQKKLVASDVQRQPGHPTGVVRLTQAGFKVNGRKIDQAKYFRKELFKDFDWSIKRRKPKVEQTEIRFDMAILGNSFGIQRLAVSHKPSGEARQRNYTSSLHWGSLGDKVKKLRLVGKTLRLYGPPKGKRGPFFVEIA